VVDIRPRAPVQTYSDLAGTEVLMLSWALIFSSQEADLEVIKVDEFSRCKFLGNHGDLKAERARDIVM
jgi:hypothetical protein